MKEVQGMAFLLCAIISVSIIVGCVGAEQQKQAPNTGTIPHKSVIASLDPNSVFKTISTNRGPTLIEFYSPGCGTVSPSYLTLKHFKTRYFIQVIARISPPCTNSSAQIYGREGLILQR